MKTTTTASKIRITPSIAPHPGTRQQLRNMQPGHSRILNTAILFFTALLLPAATILAQPANAVLWKAPIFPLQQQHVHASSLVALPKGDLLVAWFQGNGERNADDVRIMGARLKQGQHQWSSPFLMADTYGLPDCNPVLFLNHHKKLFLIWIAVQANRWEQSLLKYRTSTDYQGNGAPQWNWQGNILLKPDNRFSEEVARKFKTLPPTGAGWAAYAPRYDDMIIEASTDPAKRSLGWQSRIQPLLGNQEEILLPLYSDGFNFSLVARSTDDGKRWTPMLPIVGRGNVQPSLIAKKDGTLLAYMRDNGDSPGRVQLSRSKDDGLHWTAAQKTALPNTASVKVLALKSGRWALLGNDTDQGRYHLSLYLSDDEGRSWKWKMALENDPTKKGKFSYPSMIQTSDGLLHITYSYEPEANKESIFYMVVDPRKIPPTDQTVPHK